MHEHLPPRTWPAAVGVPSGHDGEPASDDRHPLVVEIELLQARLDEAQRKADNLEAALGTGREIGVAIGIIMARRLITHEQSFAVLQEVSQRTHRKVRDVAADVVATGEPPG